MCNCKNTSPTFNISSAFRTMILAVSGYKGAGKTTFIDGILSMLGKEYDVLVIKDTHGGIDVRGKDTYKHTEAGAFASAIVSDSETAIFFRERMDAERIASMADADVILLEGFKGSRYPKIWLGEAGAGEENIVMKNPTVGEACSYIVREVKRERVLEKLPRIDCGECGHATCGEMAEAVVDGRATIGDCRVLKREGVKVTVDGEILHINKFVGELVENTIRGMLSSLKGGEDVGGGVVVVKLPAKGDNF